MNTNINPIQWRKVTQHWIINMDYILYIMPKLWNNTQALDFPKSKYFAHLYTSGSRHIFSLKYEFYMLILTPYFDVTVLWYLNCYLFSPFFLFIQNIKRSYYLLAFTTTVVLSLNYLKFANKSKIIPFRKSDWLTKITRILDGDVYLESVNEYLIFLLLFYLSKTEI